RSRLDRSAAGASVPQNKTGPPVGRAGVESPLGLPVQVNRDTRSGERQSYANLPRERVASPSFPRNLTWYARSSDDSQLPQEYKFCHVDFFRTQNRAKSPCPLYPRKRTYVTHYARATGALKSVIACSWRLPPHHGALRREQRSCITLAATFPLLGLPCSTQQGANAGLFFD